MPVSQKSFAPTRGGVATLVADRVESNFLLKKVGDSGKGNDHRANIGAHIPKKCWASEEVS